MATLSPAREMMTLASHTDKRDVILFHSNPEISHGSKSRMSNGSLMHSYHHHHHQNHNHYSQSDIPKYSVSFSEPQIDHGRNINGGVLNTDYHVLRMAEVQIPSLDYDNVVPLTRINHIEKKGGVDATVHSINEHHASSVLFPPLDSGDAVAEGGGFVNGESGRHPSCEGYKGEPGDSRNTQGGSLNGTEGDQNFTCVGAETSREADARKSQMGNDLFSARTANVSDARADTRENGNKERLNNTGRPNKGIVYGKYTATRVTDTTYCKLHAETTFIDQPNLSYGVVRSHPETQRCDKLIDKTTSTRVYDVDLAVTNKQPDRYRATGELSIIPDTVSTKHVGAKDITEDRRFIIMPASVCTGTGGLSTREPVISTSSNDISSSATIMSTSTSVLSPGAKDEPTEAVVSLSGADFSTNSRFETVSSVANTSSIRQPLSEKVAKHTETTTSHNYNGSLIGPKLDLTATHIPSSVVLLPELPMIVITPSIPEATSSPSPATSIPSPALSSPDRTVENISHSQPCESLVGTTDNVEHNHVIGDKDISSTEIKASDADDIPLSKPAPVGGVKVLPSKFTFNVSKFKETKRADSLATDVLSTSDTSAQLSTGPMIQAERTNGAHHLPLEGVGKDPQHSSELSSTACTLGSTTTNVSTATSMPGITVPSSVMVTTDHSAPGAAFTTNASQSGAALTSATASGAAFTTNASQSGAALASVTVSGAAFTTNASESRTALTTSATVSGAAFTTEKAATSSCVLSEYKYPPASAATDTVAFAKQTGDYWSDYAVPSDLPLTPTLESSAKEVTITSNGENESIEDHTKTTVRIVNGSKDRKDTFTSHSVLSVSPDKEAIYATPIPKSQRLPVADSEHFPGKTTPAEVPLKPPRSPVSDTESPQVNKADDDAFDDVIMRKPERANNQMKKSTTTGTLHSYSSDYSNIPNTVSHKYDYFSLGRRPKRPRIKTLTDSQGMAVSLDMLLRSRRQSVVDMSIPADNEQTLSVDDILKSCLEFDDDCSFYRSRTNSDVVKNSSKKPLSFREVHDIKLLNVDLPGKEKQGKHNAASSKPILKKGDSSNRKHDTLGAKKTNGTSDIITRNKTQESKHSKPPGTRSYSSSTHGQENEKQIVISKKEATKRPDSVKSYILSDSETGTEYHASAKDTKSHNSSAKSESSSSHNMCNPDYESIGDTCTSQLPTADTSQVSSAGTSQHPSAGTTQPPSAGTTQPPSAGTTQPHSAGTTHPPSASTTQLPSAGTPHLPPAVVFSSTGSRQHHPTTQEDACVHVDTTSARPSAFPEADPDVSVTILPPPPAAGSPTPTIHLSISDNRPSSLPHLKQSFVTISTPNGHTSASSPVAASSSTEASSLSPDFRDLSSSFSDRPSPSLSTGFGSESAVTSNGGVLSLLSVDVRETSPGDSPSPGQRSPSCDPKLEAAEALKWLRAAGFPQYAQMFDDGQFPVDMGIVERDHDFLDKDSLQSLFRRLETLNRYAGIKRDSHPCKKSTSEEEDEDDFCALSERWEYQKSARRWSRKDLAPSCQLTTVALKDDLAARSGSHDSLLADQDTGSQVGDSPLLKSKISHKSVIQSPGTNDMVSVSHQALAAAEITPGNTDLVDSPMSPPLRRATSEKTKTAKNLFKKMEGMKSGKSRRQSSHRNIVEISGPVVADKQNMQAKLEKLNCVDIPQGANTQLRPRVNVSESSDRGLSSSTESHHLPSSTCGAQPSPPSPHPPSSPRPHSDFLLRSKEGRPHVPPQTGNHTRPSSTSTNQRPSLAHDSSFEEYYQAQTAFLQNLQSSPRSTAESVRKNNSETNLMEIFLVPQDHQPGRFPRVLQNGYIETEACGTAVNVRTGSVRLGRNSCMKSDHGTASLRSPQLSEAESLANRLSVYDNCSSPSGEERQGKRSEESQSSSAIPSATEVRSSGESKQTTDSLIRESTEVDKHGFIQEVNSDSSREDSRDTSRESSVVRTTWNFSHQPLRNPDHERSVSFESSTSSQSPDDSTLVNVEDLASTDSKSSKLSSSDSLSSKSKVTHSSSVDSYFRGISSQSGRPVSDSSTTMPANTFQENYDEFDRILQELYKNINDLTTFMDKDKNEKTPRLVRAATSPLPAGSPHPHSPLHVATAPVRPILRPQQNVPEPKSPSSATSDLVHSPASPGSPEDSNEPLDFYGALELDHENSSSGGEGSNTAESGSEDQALTDISQDDSLDQIIEVSRERRDSGVGHSLTRAPSDRRRKKIRWHSFQKSHRPDISSRAMQINSLTVSQLVRLQKLSLLRLTGIMEKCLPVNKSGWNWMVPRFMKRHKAPDFSDKNVFGVPLSVMAQRTGQPLPQCVLYAMRYLRRTCPSAVGIFRKSGVKSKIQQLRDYLEAHPDTTNFDGENAYNVADMLKTFFRDLPECLLTNKMSETFRSIYTYVPQPQRLDAIQAAILLLPDENREVLQSILLFLSDISEHEADHQMNASNLAVCFTPTVFHLGPRQSVPYSPKRNRKNSSGVPDPREIMEQKAAHECLLMMITDCKKLFTVPSNLFRQLQVQSVAHLEASLPQDIGSCPADVRAFGQEKIQMVLKESHDKNRGWLPTMTIGDVEVFHRKPMDDCLLKEWKLIVDIEAPPVEVLRRIMHERHTWDEDLLSWSVVERLDQHSDIFQFVLNSMAPHPPRNFCVLRYWRSDLNKGACALITMSVEHSDTLEIQGVWAVDLGTYYLMEPCGSGRSRLTYITRVDTRGRMPEWYTKIFGHICANFLDRLKESFKQDASGPETKV